MQIKLSFVFVLSENFEISHTSASLNNIVTSFACSNLTSSTSAFSAG